MDIASAARVADALGVRYRPNGWTPAKATCHPSKSDASLRFRDPDRPGDSLVVKCWGGCDTLAARHALQDATGLSLCRCQECYEFDRRGEVRPPPKRPPAPPPQARATTPADAQRAWARGLPVPRNPDHPARLWCAVWSAWRPRLELPPMVRWLPPRRRDDPHAGSLMVLLAPLPAWAAAWPELPAPQAVQLVAVDAQGGKAHPFNHKGRLEDKHDIGPTRGAVALVGVPLPPVAFGLAVAEGLKDGLKLAAHFPDTALMVHGTSGLLGLANDPAAVAALAAWPDVAIWRDEDPDGLAAAQRLAAVVNAHRPTAPATLRHVPGVKDPGAVPAPFAPLASDAVRDAAAAYAAAADLPQWEALRWATTT